MRRILIYSAAVLALAACGPAKMGTRNGPADPQVKSQPEPAVVPAAPQTADAEPIPTMKTPSLTTEAPAKAVEVPSAPVAMPKVAAPSPAADDDERFVPKTPQTAEKVAIQPSGAAVPVMPDSKTKVFDPGSENSQPTCAGDDCNENYMTDAGNYVTKQPFRLKPLTQKLDLIFILDTSSSMKDEHEKISREISNFIAKLSPEVSFRIGVMLAHGPGTKAKGVKVGHLFSRDGQDPVIDSEDILRAVKRDSNLVSALQQQGVQGRELEKRQRQQAAAQISELMKSRLANLPNDGSKAQGEAGLLNIYKALAGAQEQSDLKRAGLLRDEAALLVVFAADEQDMCFDYSRPSLVTGTLVKGNYDTENDRRAEKAAFAAADICGEVTTDRRRLTPQHVLDAAKQAKGEMPVIFTGIHYISEQIPPTADKHADDNEMGHGYLDLIKLADGRAVDLSTQNFGHVLAEIGAFSNAKMKFETNSFKIPGNVDVNRLDPQSIGVMIQTADGEKHPVAGENVSTPKTTDRAEVAIKYEALEYAYKQGWANPGSELIIHYGYKD